MKKLLISLLMLVVLASFALPTPTAHSQLGGFFANTFVFEDGTTFQYPNDWRPFIRPNGYTFIASADTQILFSLNAPTVFSEYEVADGDLAGFLVESFGALTETETVDPAAITPVTLGTHAAVQSITTTEDEFGGIEHWVFITQLNNSMVLYISVLNLTGDTITEPDDVLSILNSMDESKSTYTPESLDLSRPELTETYTLRNGATINYPADWEIESFDDPEADFELNIFNDLTTIVVDPMGADAFARGGVEEGDLNGLFAAAFAPLDSSLVFDPALVYPFNLDDYDGMRYDYTDTDNQGVAFERTVMIVQLPTGEVIYLAIAPQQDATIVEIPIALQILASILAPGEGDTGLGGDGVTDFYTFEDGTTVTWDTSIWTFVEEEGFLYLDSANTSILFGKYFSTVYADNNVAEGDNAALMGALYYSKDKSIAYDPTLFQEITVGSFRGGRYDFVDRLEDGTEYQHSFVMIQFSDNSVALFSVIPWSGFAITEMDLVLDVVATFTDVK